MREVSSQVQSMRMTYEKTQKELNERLERSTQENVVMVETTKALELERQRVDELQVGVSLFHYISKPNSLITTSFVQLRRKGSKHLLAAVIMIIRRK